MIAFDADDTLWANQNYFDEIKDEFCDLMKGYMPAQQVSDELYKTEMQNLELYGYGIKSFVLSMTKTAIRISDNKVPNQTIEKIMDLGTELLQKPIELLDGVEEVLDTLNSKYRLIVATKGDLLDQQKKVKRSGLTQYFEHIEVMSEKRSDDYQRLLKNVGCSSSEFLMIGNSLKSDILPVIEVGGQAAHVPYHLTWEHEVVDSNSLDTSRFISIPRISDILPYLAG